MTSAAPPPASADSTPTPAPLTNGTHHSSSSCVTTPIPLSRPTILHLGDPIFYNHAIHDRLHSKFEIINPAASDLDRSTFKQHLKDRTWGDFSAIMRPFWRSGNAMARWDRELIELLPSSMKVMASAGAGFDWVDTEILGEHGIIYCNGAGASTESVADMALYLIIAVFRHMTSSFLSARSNSPTRWQEAHQWVPSRSHNPRGHTLGIIGLGNIGFAIAQKVKVALGMKILYSDLYRKTEAQEQEVEAMYYEKLEDLLPQCHCVLIATPAGKSLLTAETIKLLPYGARVVNIARGSLIDETALADALDSGHIDAAGLDVHAHEPRVNERLTRMDNVTLTSHTGGGSIETNIAFERLAMENVERVLTGNEPLTAVNLDTFREKPSANGNRSTVRGNGYPASGNDQAANGNGHAGNHIDGSVQSDKRNYPFPDTMVSAKRAAVESDGHLPLTNAPAANRTAHQDDTNHHAGLANGVT